MKGDESESAPERGREREDKRESVGEMAEEGERGKRPNRH